MYDTNKLLKSQKQCTVYDTNKLEKITSFVQLFTIEKFILNVTQFLNCSLIRIAKGNENKKKKTMDRETALNIKLQLILNCY